MKNYFLAQNAIFLFQVENRCDRIPTMSRDINKGIDPSMQYIIVSSQLIDSSLHALIPILP